MKKIIYFLLTSFLVLFSVSCKSDFLDTEPSDEVDYELAIIDMKTANTVLNGVYFMIKGGSADENGKSVTYSEYYAADMIYYGDVRGTDVMATGRSGRGRWAYTMTFTGTSGADNMWYIPYKVIDRANRLIEKMENGDAKGATDQEINNIVAQCRMARALAHFDLLRIYSKFYDESSVGVPVVLTPSDYKVMPSRNSVKEVFEQAIMPDLNYAIKNMNSKNGNGYFNKWSAMALLARVYQYRGMDDKALETAQEVIEQSPYKLWTNSNYVNSWKVDPQDQESTEILFEIIISSSVDWTDRNGIAYLYSRSGYGDMKISKNFYDLLDKSYNKDIRKDMLIKYNEGESSATNGLNVWINKYPTKSGQTDIRIANVSLFRLSEMYLIAAESAFKTNKKDIAVKRLNEIIERGDATATQVSESTISLDRILQERRVELFGEGHRYFDLVRNNMEIVRYTNEEDKGWNLILNAQAKSYNRDFYKAILPLPQAEINANPNIAEQQNSGY